MGCDQMVIKAYKVVLSDMGKDHQNHMAMEMVLKELGRLSEDGAGDDLEAKRVELIHGGDDSSYEQVELDLFLLDPLLSSHDVSLICFFGVFRVSFM